MTDNVPSAGKFAGVTCILNGASNQAEAAREYLARVSGEFGVQSRIVVTQRGDDISSLVAGAVAESGISFDGSSPAS